MFSPAALVQSLNPATRLFVRFNINSALSVNGSTLSLFPINLLLSSSFHLSRPPSNSCSGILLQRLLRRREWLGPQVPTLPLLLICIVDAKTDISDSKVSPFWLLPKAFSERGLHQYEGVVSQSFPAPHGMIGGRLRAGVRAPCVFWPPPNAVQCSSTSGEGSIAPWRVCCMEWNRVGGRGPRANALINCVRVSARVCASASLLQMPSVEISRPSHVQKFPLLHCDFGCPLRCQSLSPSRHPASHEL
ncbi:hypothetical protein LY78DRAFT_294924 [Colletotrichum sublineola]|nr:hypothetical protein LY78DRAFT_294924 [Colletotrichum sublineola]